MNDIEYILDFAANLGCKMLTVGANLERVNDTMYRICCSYQLNSISIFSLSSLITISAKSESNQTGTRQISVPYVSNHLEKLNRFNQLSRKVCAERPAPKKLAEMLAEAENIKKTPIPLVVLGHLFSMTSLCAIYGGSLLDIVAVDINPVFFYFLGEFFDRRNINRIVVNSLCAWAAGSLALLFVRLGLGDNYFIIIVTNSMMMMPGISLMNAIRNILCGNEMNGILEFLKVVLESVAIVLGLVLSIYLFGGQMIQWQKV